VGVEPSSTPKGLIQPTKKRDNDWPDSDILIALYLLITASNRTKPHSFAEACHLLFWSSDSFEGFESFNELRLYTVSCVIPWNYPIWLRAWQMFGDRWLAPWPLYSVRGFQVFDWRTPKQLVSGAWCCEQKRRPGNSGTKKGRKEHP